MASTDFEQSSADGLEHRYGSPAQRAEGVLHAGVGVLLAVQAHGRAR